MKKRLLAMFVAVCLVVSFVPTAFAAESDGGVRETNFFTEQEHSDVNFEDMEYVHMELEDIQADIDAIAALIDDADNAAQVTEKFDELVDTMMELITMYTLVNIKTSQDIDDDEAYEELLYVDELYSRAFDALSVLMREILNSPCAAVLEEVLDEESIEYYKNYEEMTEEELERSLRETELENAYYDAVYASYTVEVAEGVFMTVDEALDSVYAAIDNYYADPSDETYSAYSEAYALYIAAYEGNIRAANAACGEIYLELVALRNEIAKEAGYANYTEYAYENVYYRDYSPSDIRAFQNAVKEYIPSVTSALDILVNSSDSNVFDADYTGDVAFDMMAPYVGQISSELLEAFTYMRDHNLYDYGYGEGTKDGSGFTTILYSYNAPFTFNTPSGTLYDFSTAVHEFGHYNRYFWTPHGFFEYEDDIDQAEVHSQGLELIFTQFYDDIFGEDSQDVLNYLMSNLTGSLIDGCLHDELQQFAYSTENLTLDMLNEEYFRLSVEYGQTSADDDGHGYYSYGWFYVHHTIDRPFYYISYATSAAGALSFWLDAQENGFEAAEDAYLTYASLPAEMGLREGLAAAGVDDPLTAAYVEELAAALWAALDIDAQFGTGYLPPYSDVDDSAWYAEAVNSLGEVGLVAGYGDGTFGPMDAMDWGTLLVLFELDPEEMGIEDLEASITRLEFAQLLDASLNLGPATAASPFSDTDDASVANLAELGLIAGCGDGTFQPDRDLTRAEFCVILYRAFDLLLSE